ncbi:MAG: ABC transporter ATP-binding protein [Chloroflexota bacterium]
MIDIVDVSFAYDEYKILSQVSAQLETGQIVMLVGKNGTGKSTLLRCIAGWSRPDEGHISVNNKLAHRHPRTYYDDLVFVPDTPDFYTTLTAWEHLQFIGELHHLKDWQSRGENLLDTFQLIDHRDTFPFTFSRGMRYKLSLCLALLKEPQFLLLDEPFGPLDDLAKLNLWHVLNEYIARNNSVLLSTHTILPTTTPDLIWHLNNATLEILNPDDTVNLSELFDVE